MSLADDFRRRAKEQRDAATLLLGSDTLFSDEKKQIAVIVGQVTANLYDGLADMVSYLRAASDKDGIQDLRRRHAQFNDAVRKASAAGDWDQFERLIKSLDPGAESAGES
jgi:hypothetical protein